VTRRYALDGARVALVPGKAFGCDNFVRLSYATGMQGVSFGQKYIEKVLLQSTVLMKYEEEPFQL